MTDDTPTQRIPENPGEATAQTSELQEERKKSRALLFVLIGVGAALVAVIVLLLVLLLGGGASGEAADPDASGSPSATPTESESPTPSATPSETPSAEPSPSATAAPPSAPAADTAPAFTSFTSTQTVSCNTQFPPGYVPPTVSFNYSTKNASSVWFQTGEGDAANAGAFPMPLNGNKSDVYGPGSSIEYPCPLASQKYTLTIVGTNGQHLNKVFTVTNTGDTQ